MTTAGYSGRPLTGKLGVKPGSRVLLRAAPAGFTLDCEYDTTADGSPYDVQLLFCPMLADLDAAWSTAVTALTVPGALWVAWPKRASGVPTDLTDDVVREYGLDHGLVDVKVCAVDGTWSALKLVRRKQDR
ncbi:MAG TPA: DUF3052 domain-containing protein [Pseudonocardiaceae bacterium]|nr:DUF3052 domain-containing protein [Pseudonocardiaceae bacterium]